MAGLGDRLKKLIQEQEPLDSPGHSWDDPIVLEEAEITHVPADPIPQSPQRSVIEELDEALTSQLAEYTHRHEKLVEVISTVTKKYEEALERLVQKKHEMEIAIKTIQKARVVFDEECTVPPANKSRKSKPNETDKQVPLAEG